MRVTLAGLTGSMDQRIAEYNARFAKPAVVEVPVVEVPVVEVPAPFYNERFYDFEYDL